jgi:F-type H+-transporting ATPase subunit a
MASVNPLELIRHVQDAPEFHVPVVLWDLLPAAIKGENPEPGAIPLPKADLLGYELQITRFMLVEVLVAMLLVAIFVPLARKIGSGEPPQGRLWNFFEVILLFVRNEIVRPIIGKRDGDRFLPFIWTIFFFVLGCNLMGLVPWAGSPTAAWACTASLAGVTLVTVIGAGIWKHGAVGFWTGQVPEMDLPRPLGIVIKPMIFVLELAGIAIRHFVLSVRLVANMFAGHLVLAVVVGFIAMAATANIIVWSSVTVGSVAGAVALSLLELLVAFLQAYIFAFLSALFIGMAIHRH